MSEAKKLQEHAEHCRELARVACDKLVQKELLRLAEEFVAEAQKAATREAD